MSVHTTTAQPTGQATAMRKLFARNLCVLMTRKDVLPGDLAVDLGVSTPRIERWMQAVCFPQVPVLVRLCHRLDYTDMVGFLTKEV